MKDFKIELEKAGIEKVQTYIQSGNLVIESNLKEVQLRVIMNEVLTTQFSIQTNCSFYTAEEIEQIIDENPFKESNPVEGKWMHYALLEDEVKADVSIFEKYQVNGELIALKGKCLYMVTPNGVGNSKITLKLIEKQLGTNATMRNQNTLNKLLQM